MMDMWDGYGFADTAFETDKTKTYQTYKLALAIILRKRLGLPIPATESLMIEIIKICQQENGGIITGYYQDLQTRGNLANTETTALVIIATEPTPTPTPSPSPTPDNVNGLVLVIVVFAIAIIIISVIVIITKTANITKQG
jgi:hypothetical protein